MIKMAPRKMKIITLTCAIITISVLIGAQKSGAQSSKGAAAGSQQTSISNNRPQAYSPPAPSPVTQLRQQQQQRQEPNFRSDQGPSKKKAQKQQQQQQQVRQQQQEARDSAPTEDPLSDSEPALYGSVAGAPGVDFPAYTRIPKTSFTCEGKGFDFGFYADEEAQCQVYHVCWSGRRESFLCGVGTVFNQAILACDYWHSVDCSKSSQFYGVNSELGKAGAEPASSGSQRTQPARTQATLPSSSSFLGSPATSSSSSGNSNSNSISRPSSSSANFGEPINQRRTGSANQQQPQQQTITDDSNYDAPQQQQVQVPVQTPVFRATDRQISTTTAATNTFAPQRSQPPQRQAQNYDSFPQQRQVQVTDTPPVKSAARQTQQVPTTSVATPVKRARFNMDFNQKVNSLIDSPVRPPLKVQQQQQSAGVKQPARQQQQQQPTKQANFAQAAVARAQQSGSQSLNPGFARKNTAAQVNYQPQQPQPQQQPQFQPQQQQQSYDHELDEPVQQQQQQQQTFDDSPVQTSTVQSTGYGRENGQSPVAASQLPSFVPQQSIQTIRAGGSGDGSSAITTQYDTMSPVGASSSDQSYESPNDDSSSSNLNDDFRSAGAKAAASNNQNWYIMRTI